MKWLLKILFEILSSLFRWRANVTSPEHTYEEKNKAWTEELERLQSEKKKCSERYKFAVTAGVSVDNINRLWAEWLQATEDTGNHRAREPRRPVRKLEYSVHS